MNKIANTAAMVVARTTIGAGVIAVVGGILFAADRVLPEKTTGQKMVKLVASAAATGYALNYVEKITIKAANAGVKALSEAR